MPAALVAKLAETTNIDIAEAEKRWKRAKEITTEDKGLKESDGDEFWKYVTGVFKKSMGIGAVMESAEGKPLVDRMRLRGGPPYSEDVCPTCGSTNLYGTRGMTNDRGCQDCHAYWHYLDGERVMGRSFDLYQVCIMEAATAEEIHAAAHEAATSHLNDLPEPTQKQLEAGNYKHGHVTMHGLRISIENPKGSKRRGVDPDGTTWEVTMAATYGFFKGSLAKDGDHVDCYIGDHPESELVFIVDQCDAETGLYDEAKVYLGTLSQKEARDLYIAGFSDGKGAKRLGAMTAMHMPDFKAWLREGDTTKPLSDTIMESAVSPKDAEAVRVKLQKMRDQAHKLKGKKTVFQQGKASLVSASDKDIKKADELFLQANELEDQWYAALHPNLFSPEEMADAIAKGLPHIAPIWRTMILSAASFDDIQAAFSLKWPGFIARLDSADSFLESKVVDASGALLRVYHGTSKERRSAYSDDDGEAITFDHMPVFFTSSRAQAKIYAQGEGAEVVEAYIDVKNPYVVEDYDYMAGADGSLYDDADYLKEEGYDGAVFKDKDGTEVWAVFNPGQIKRINRLTNNSDGDKVVASTDREGAMDNVSKDGFYKVGKPTAFYIEKLKELGAPEDIITLAKELTAKKKPVNVSNASEDGVQQDVMKWDGAELYYLSKGEWGFNRISIMPSNGYVDFGQGEAANEPKVQAAKRLTTKPEVEYEGKVYKVKSANTAIPDFTAMDRLESLMWLNRNTVAKGYSKKINPLAGLAGVITINGE